MTGAEAEVSRSRDGLGRSVCKAVSMEGLGSEINNL